MKKYLLFALTVCAMGILGGKAYADYDPRLDYQDIMMEAASCGDFEAGRAAQICLHEALDDRHSKQIRVNFEDLYWLAKIIYSEAGSDFLSMDWKMCVGEVVLNRVASPEFPDTVYDVIFQEGQYSESRSEEFINEMQPSIECVWAAYRLLQGERMMSPWVVFQANFPQGGGVYACYYDSKLGYTYFCSSTKPELY